MRNTPLLTEGQRWRFDQGDCLEWLAGLPADSVDLVVTSPPYEDARLYLEGGKDVGIARGPEEWVAWMGDVVRACLRVCTGLIAVVCEGRQRNWAYSASPFLLLADLVRSGVTARHPAVYYRHSTPGSGRDAWANFWEPILLFTRGGRLPWSNPTACGHPPKYAPGGECSNRLADGSRVNQWGQTVGNETSGASRRADGTRQRPGRPSHHNQTRRRQGTPVLANPGNIRQQTYTADEVAALLAEQGDVIRCKVGGGHMGHKAAHDNEAPYPESLVEPFVLTFCPPGGIVLDPFSGSGTTVAAAVRLGRRGLGCDLRQSQVELAERRLRGAQLPLFSQDAPVTEDTTDA